jgi:hypothetical protein
MEQSTQIAGETETIAKLNDRVRQGLDRNAKIVFTANIIAKLANDTLFQRIAAQARLMKMIRQVDFADDSPERDVAFFEIDGVKAMMKIDYYDENIQFGSEDPSDASKTTRVLTIMAVEDY